MRATLVDSRYEIVAQQIISPDTRFDSNPFLYCIYTSSLYLTSPSSKLLDDLSKKWQNF